MAFSGSLVSDFSNIITRLPAARQIINSVEYNNAAFQLFNRDASRLVPDESADYWTIRYYDGVDITAGARSETGDMRLPGKHTTSAGRVYPTEISGAIGWTQWEMNLLRGNVNAFAQRYVDKLAGFLDGYKWIHQCVQLGDRGRLGRVSSYSAISATSGTVTIDSNVANFGVSDIGAHLKNKMMVDIYTATDITGSAAWVLKARGVMVSLLNRAASSTTCTFVITTLANDASSEIDAAPADGDFVFLADAVGLDADMKFDEWRYPIGLWSIIDKGGAEGQEYHSGSSNAYNASWNGITIQNRDRSDVALYKSVISRAGDRGGTAGTVQETSLDEIMEVIRELDESLDSSRPNSKAMLANGAVVDWMGQLTANTRNAMITLPQSENIMPGLATDEFFKTSTGRIPIFRLPHLSKSQITIVNWDDIYRLDVEPMGPVAYQPGGPMQFPSPATRNRTFESWVVWGGANWFTRADHCARIEDIDRDVT